RQADMPAAGSTVAARPNRPRAACRKSSARSRPQTSSARSAVCGISRYPLSIVLRRFLLFGRQDAARLLDVARDLRHQVLNVVKAPLGPQPADELDDQVAAVEVASIVEDVHF